MIKFSPLICMFLIIFHVGNSEQLEFGKFFGSCPNVSLNPRPVLETGEEEWYTNQVVGGFLPWRNLRCQSTLFNFKSLVADEPSTVKTRFSLPILPFSFEIGGTIERSRTGNYVFNYQSSVFGNVQQKTVVLLDYTHAALVYSCLDFKFFHLDSIQVMSRFKTSSQWINNAGLGKNYITSVVEGAGRSFGVSPGSFVEIDQSC